MSSSVEALGERTWTPNRPIQGRWQWRALGFALGALLALFVAPGSSWIARYQFGYSVPASLQHLSSPERAHRLKQVAERYPNDVDVQTALALTVDLDTLSDQRYLMDVTNSSLNMTTGPQLVNIESNRLRSQHLVNLWNLMHRFPDSPLPRALFLRLAGVPLYTIYYRRRLNDPVKVFDPSTRKYIIKAPLNSGGDGVTRPLLTDALLAAAQGERLDPHNAYFPIMALMLHSEFGIRPPLTAASHLSLDKEAYQELDRAARASHWDDGTPQLMQGIWRLDATALGLRDSLYRYNMLLDEPGNLTELAETGGLMLMDANAWMYEELKPNEVNSFSVVRRRSRTDLNLKAGIALRSRMMRVAMLMAHSPRPEFASLASLDLYSGAVENQLSANDYETLLRTAGCPAEADWTNRQVSLMDALYHQPTYEMLNKSAGIAVLGHILGGFLLISQGFVFALIGGLLAVWRYRRRFNFSAPRPLIGAIAGSIALAFVIVGGSLTLPMLGFGVDWKWYALSIGIAVIGFGLLPDSRPVLTALGLALMGLFALVGLTAWQATGIGSYLHQIAIVFSGVIDYPKTEIGEVEIGITLGALALPALLGLVLMVISRIRRIPVAAGTIRGMSALTLPVLTLLALTYVGLTFSAVRLETRTQREMQIPIHFPG